MKIGIIVAMDKELALLLPRLEGLDKTTAGSVELYSGKIGVHEVAVMKCGIGKVNAALGTMALIGEFSPQLVINTGVAGGTGGAAGVLDVVAGTGVAYHDVWCGPGTEPGDADGCPRFFEPPSGLLDLKALGEPIIKGLVCSGDRFISTADEVKAIRAMYPDAVAVDMESAAIAHACFRAGVGFLCLRVVSDTPGSADNISQYDNFWDSVPQSTFNVLSSLLDELHK